MANDTRSRMIEAAIEGLQQRGLNGMSFTDVLASSGAARGAIYHHFPGGKRQLAAEAAARFGADVLARLGNLPGVTPVGVVEAFLAEIRPVIEASTHGRGCAVAAVTVDPDPTGDELRTIAAAAFTAWGRQLATALETAGLSAESATDLASLLITVLEGSQVLCRATGNLDAFDQATRAVLRVCAMPA